MTTALQIAYNEGRLIRRDLSGKDSDGRQLPCLYTALAGDPQACPETCPASLCPQWLAHLLPWIGDAGTQEAWPRVAERVIAIESYLTSTPSRVEWTVRALCVREAMRHTSNDGVLAACECVAVLCERRGRGEAVTDVEFSDAGEGAIIAARPAWAADAATWAAGVAGAAAAGAEVAAAEAAAVRAAEAAAEAAGVAGAAAEARAAEDRLIDVILTTIEESVGVENNLGDRTRDPRIFRTA